MSRKHRTKYIFVTGGVVSSLGKGIVAASVGALLETRGLKVSLTKIDPYINVDPGTMSPFQHGEVFVTDDGAETDLDIGHYERFTRARLRKENSFSTGQVYDSVLNKERHGEYLGCTVQVVPHITNQIKEYIYRASKGADIAIIELGGTVGDIEGQPYLEAIRQIRYDLGRSEAICIHLTLVPYIEAAKELKTKPTQHSVRDLRQVGIQPDIIVCRSDRNVPEEVRNKIATTCNIGKECVFESPDLDSIYKLPLRLHEQGMDQIIVDTLNIWTGAPDLDAWKLIEKSLDHPEREVNVAVVGKYVDVVDSYKSINESLIHAGIANHARIKVHYLDATTLEKSDPENSLSSMDAVVIPGGFGNRGIEGKINAIRYCRENTKPLLGICLGMQLAAIEFARNVLGYKDAASEEFDEKATHKIIHLMDEQKSVESMGGTMRLGAYPCLVKKDSKALSVYGSTEISERHRHRYEFNNEFRNEFEKHGVSFSGVSPDNLLVEMIELSDHPWFVACQFHPELKSSPLCPHPLFNGLIKTACEGQKANA